MKSIVQVIYFIPFITHIPIISRRAGEGKPSLLATSKQAQEDAPEDPNHAAEHGTRLEGHEREADDGDCRPQFLSGKDQRERVLH